MRRPAAIGERPPAATKAATPALPIGAAPKGKGKGRPKAKAVAKSKAVAKAKARNAAAKAKARLWPKPKHNSRSLSNCHVYCFGQMSSSHVCAIAYSSHMQCASIAMCQYPSCWYVFVLYAWNLIGWLQGTEICSHGWNLMGQTRGQCMEMRNKLVLCAAKRGHVCMHVRKQNVTIYMLIAWANEVAYTVGDLLHWAHSVKKMS